jgi:hypothetical protein
MITSVQGWSSFKVKGQSSKAHVSRSRTMRCLLGIQQRDLVKSKSRMPELKCQKKKFLFNRFSQLPALYFVFISNVL